MIKYFRQKHNRKIVINSIFTILFVIVMIILFLNRDMFRYWISSGTGILPNQEYHFTPKMEDERDVVCQRFVPTVSGLSSIDVRLANEWPDDVDCILLFLIYDVQQKTVIWQESVSSEQIENWRYYSLEFSSMLGYDREYILQIQCPENRADVSFKVFMCNEELDENKRLTFNGELLDGGLDLIYNYHAFPKAYFLVLVCACVVGIVILWFGDLFFKKKPICYLVLFFSVVICFFLVEYLSGNHIFARMEFIAVCMNLCLLSSVLLLLFAVSNSSWLAGSVMNLVFLILSLINHYTLRFRGTVLLPSDIYSVSTAYDVVGNYNIDLDAEVLNALVVFMLLMVLLYKTNFKQEKKARLVVGFLGLMTLSVGGVVSASESLEYKLGLNIIQASQTERSQELGFVLNLSENLKYLRLQKPKGYSPAEVQNIYDKYTEKTDTGNAEVLPNIIVIMNESFADLRYLADFETNSEYMENFYRIAEERNSKIGKAVVSVFGGGTSCSEFEFLTGCSMLFLPSGNAPYQQYIHSEKEALPECLRQQKYNTYVLHAANPLNWNRNVAYPLLGFDRFLSTADEAFENATRCRYWIDDKSLMNEMTALYVGTKERKFEFGLTIQCHGGYTYEGYESTVFVENMSTDYPEVNQYLSLVKEVDQAFGEFIDTLRDSEEPTIVLMYGDHLPQLDIEFYGELFHQAGGFEKIEAYEPPYIIWANYDVDFSDIPDTISVNLLAPYLLKAAGVELNSYYQYLYALSEKYPVVSRMGIIDAEGGMHEYNQEDSCYEDIHEYEIIQYNWLVNG